MALAILRQLPAACMSVLTCLMFMAPTTVTAQFINQHVSVTAAPGFSQTLHVAPGETVRMGFRVVNNTSSIVNDAPLASQSYSPHLAVEEYQFVSEDPALCGNWSPFSHTVYSGFTFRAGPLPPNGSITCAYQVTRVASSRNDIRMTVGVNCGSMAFLVCGIGYTLGALPDLALSIAPTEPIPYGSASALVQITAGNSSDVSVNGVEFGACVDNGGPNFQIDNDFAGACGNGSGPICFMSGFSYAIGGVFAGGQASCLLRLVFSKPLTQPQYFQVALGTVFGDYTQAGGGIVIDPSHWNDIARLGGAPDPIFDYGFEQEVRSRSEENH